MAIDEVTGWFEPEKSTSQGDKKAKLNEMIAAINASTALDTLAELTDVTITDVADNELLAYDNGSSEWINQTPSEASLEPAISKNTAFNKNFGASAGDVPDIASALAVSSIVETDGSSELITASKATAYNKAFGTGTANVPEIGATLGNSQVAMTDANGKLITEAEQTGHNLVLGTGSGQVAVGDHTHDHDHLPTSTSREFEVCSITETDSTSKDWNISHANMTIQNTGATDFSISFICHIPTVKEGKSLNIYDIIVDIRDAAEGDEVDAVYLRGQPLDGAAVLIWSKTGLDWNTQGDKSCRTDSDLTTEDVSPYDIINIQIDVIVTNTSGLNFRPPVIEHYYA